MALPSKINPPWTLGQARAAINSLIDNLASLDPAAVAAMQAVLDDYQAGQNATDAAMASVVGITGGQTADQMALLTTPAAAMGTAAGIVADNTARTPLPQTTRLISGAPSETLLAFTNQTVTNVPSPTDPSKTVWKVVGSASGTATMRVIRQAAMSAPNPAAVAAWVYLPDPSVIQQIGIYVTTSTGSWGVLNTEVAGFPPLRQGWNLLRFHGSVKTHYASFGTISEVSVRAFYNTPGATMYVGPVVVEHRPKASLVLINDWGSKPFLDNAYPALKAAGIPVTWAMRVSVAGGGTYPNNHISVAEAKTLMGENGNEVTFHSWAGSATSGLTPEQARQEVIQAQAGLAARGLWSRAAVHRPAWVQNSAPGAPGADDLLVTAGTYSGVYGLTAWPPVDRHNIPRIGIHGRTTAELDADFAQLQVTRAAALYYTHGVVPAADAGLNHSTTEQWNYWLSKVQAGIAAGWLEAVTVPHLIARERLVLPVAPPF